MRILCLHGGQQTAEIFENQINRLCVALGSDVVCEFVDAPHLLPLRDAQDDVQTRSWCTSGPVEEGGGDYSAADALLDRCMAQAPADVMLGFSQGGMMICRYLMRHLGQPQAAPLPRGVIFAGTPDPREAFAGTALLKTFLRGVAGGGGGSAPLFGALPSMHIVGKKDAVVPPEGSRRFAADCGAAAELLVHEHAHSFPQLQAVIGAVRDFCGGVAIDPAELGELAEQRDMELEMVSAMYASQFGDDCVVQPPDMSGGAVVTLPLLSADDLDTGSVAAAATERAMAHLSLRLTLPRRYPAVLPSVAIVNGPAWHSVEFERWRADAVLRCVQHLEEDIGANTAMILPVHMFACELATADAEKLRALFSPPVVEAAGGEGEQRGGPASPGDNSLWSKAWMAVWEQEDEEARATYIEAAEAKALALLRAKAGSNQQQQQQQQKQAGEAEEDAQAGEEGGEVGGMTTASSSRRGGGSWTLTIGLIGKPSAGKSTFFNAVTDPQGESEAARIAAFPFTTIEPNIGPGFGGLPCPCSMLSRGAEAAGRLCAGFGDCDASYGHVTVKGAAHFRRHPILVKDVAGLVQGAYEGKGKGNQFLNDLCDADVLVHVVDGAGATHADGSACAPGQGSTLNDITWVRSEVHSWIYDNLRAKWQSIRRVPGKLRTMFSGYRSSPSFVDAVLQRMDIPNELALDTLLPTWGPPELHLLVALYTRMRFPMVVALNKSDLPTAPALAAQLRQQYPDEHFVPMSAQAEWDLLQLRKRGHVAYLSGEDSFTDRTQGGATATATAAVDKADAERLRRLHHFFASAIQQRPPAGAKGKGAAAAAAATLTSTGVQEVIAEALSRCPAVLVYPVSAFHPAIPSLKHCFSFKPGTNADEVFWAMSYARLLDGKLVRFEVIEAPTSAHPGSSGIAAAPTAPMSLKKMDPLPSRSVFVRVLSNKRQKT